MERGKNQKKKQKHDPGGAYTRFAVRRSVVTTLYVSIWFICLTARFVVVAVSILVLLASCHSGWPPPTMCGWDGIRDLVLAFVARMLLPTCRLWGRVCAC